MDISIPSNYREVPVSDFEEFLRTCPNYLRDGFSNLITYQFKHSHKRFAAVTGEPGSGLEKVFVSPDVLEPVK